MLLNRSNPIISQSFVVLTLTATLFVSGCSEPTATVQQDVTPQTVKLAAAKDMPDYSEYEFPAEVAAVKTIDVSFEVAGRLEATNLRTGSIVKQGDVLAQLDPTSFNQRLEEAQTRLTQATRDKDRTVATFDKGLSSQSQLDNAKTNFELAKIALNKAQQNLSYTQLKAPFDAQVSERFVDNNSFVKVGDIVARLQDVSRFYFNINVPERLLTGYRQGADIKADANIISAPEKSYQLEYIEHATQPDPLTQTYKVVFAAQTTDPTLTPGARAKVRLKLGYQRFGDGLLIPITALVGNADEGFHVWRYSPETTKISKANVTVLHIKDHYALVTGELSVGDQVVAAGASKMRPNMSVQPYVADH